MLSKKLLLSKIWDRGNFSKLKPQLSNCKKDQYAFKNKGSTMNFREMFLRSI